jgi:hypothetical protein
MYYSIQTLCRAVFKIVDLIHIGQNPRRDETRPCIDKTIHSVTHNATLPFVKWAVSIYRTTPELHQHRDFTKHKYRFPFANTSSARRKKFTSHTFRAVFFVDSVK